MGAKLFNDNQRIDYIAFIRESITVDEIQILKHAARTGRQLGDEKFTKKMEKKIDKRFALRSPGRHKKESS